MKAGKSRIHPNTNMYVRYSSTGSRCSSSGSSSSISSRWSLVGASLCGVSMCLHMMLPPPVVTSFVVTPTTFSTSNNRLVQVLPEKIKRSTTRATGRLSSIATVSSLSPPQVLTKEEIQNIQAEVEQSAIDNHDDFAMNALFVHIPEQPTPQPCTFLDEGEGEDGGVSGNLPPDLPPGCLLRIGPNGAPKEDGFLDGDGMIHSITLPPADSKDHRLPMYAATYVQTNGRILEEQMQKAAGGKNNKDPVKFKGTLGSAPNGWPMLKNLVENGINFQTLTCSKDTCNTAMAISGKRILALMEQSRPSEISVSKNGRLETLASMVSLDGAIADAPLSGGNFGAHGRTDVKTGERIHVSYNSNERPFVRVDSFDGDWVIKSSWGVDVPAPIMVHDCAMSSKYVIVCDFPLTIRPKRLIQNKFPVEYESDHGARIGLSPREGNGSDRDTLWFEVESGVVLHLVNAYDRDDGAVVIHGFKAVPKENASYILDYTPPFLHEWVIDPISKKVLADRCLNPREAVEFPAIDDRDVSAVSTYCYGMRATSIGAVKQFSTPQTGILLDEVLKFSLQNGNEDGENGIAAGDVIGRYMLPSGWHYVSEPTVVSKTSSGGGHYVLLIATEVPETGRSDFDDHVQFAHENMMKSKLIVLDGDNISEGPVCTVQLPSHMNYGLHSLFVPWECMK